MDDEINNITYYESVYIGSGYCVRALQLSRNNKYFVSGSSDTTVKLWSIKSNKLIHTYFGHKSEARSITISKDNKLIISGG